MINTGWSLEEAIDYWRGDVESLSHEILQMESDHEYAQMRIDFLRQVEERLKEEQKQPVKTLAELRREYEAAMKAYRQALACTVRRCYGCDSDR